MVERLDIAYSRKFIHSLDSQLNMLFRQGVVNRIDKAEELASEVYDFVENNLDKAIDTPEKYWTSGKKYLRFMIDDNYTWFVFFDQEGNKVIVNHLQNNQTEELAKL